MGGGDTEIMITPHERKRWEAADSEGDAETSRGCQTNRQAVTPFSGPQAVPRKSAGPSFKCAGDSETVDNGSTRLVECK